MAEIKIERRRASLLPWILGLVLLALVILAAATAARRHAAAPVHRTGGAAAADTQWDNIPPKLRQYA
ncbi:MAG TPA: hypothetical protein VLR69_14285 [Thermoanaerobaculia bacterium]|nr:hypothetical protein [Thermoanaerobaculia bacterium]